MVVFDEEKSKRELAEIKQKEEEELLKFLAQKNGLPYIDLTPVSVGNDALRLIPEDEARFAKVAPFALVGKKVSVAIFTPNTPEVQGAVKKIADAGYQAEVYMASQKSLEKAWSHYKELSHATESYAGRLDVSMAAIEEAAKSTQRLKDIIPKIEEVAASKARSRISRLIEVIIGTGIALGASDIHVEPEEESVKLRYRLDGILHDVTRFDRSTYAFMNSRLKILSGLKLNLQKEAQDGRFSVTFGETSIEIRASVLPGTYGESIVLRLLDPKSISVPLEGLGIHKVLLDVIGKAITKPNGMVLTTGPTGSGKTTTLYAFLQKIHVPGVKIITIEDPIEYHLAGITQTQVEPEHHYTFASGLRAALRQDPDIIMIGEIRDEETAEIAVNASLTGHLVFTTLHTNDAAGTFPRLIDLGVDPKAIGSAITIAMAQRLVRKLCEHCKVETPIPAADRVRIEAALKTMPSGIEIPQQEHYWKPKGCEQCNDIGYRGRTGIYEGILTDSTIERIVREHASEREIAAAARPQGIPTMQQDGILKILAGVTSLEELERVVSLEA